MRRITSCLEDATGSLGRSRSSEEVSVIEMERRATVSRSDFKNTVRHTGLKSLLTLI